MQGNFSKSRRFAVSFRFLPFSLAFWSKFTVNVCLSSVERRFQLAIMSSSFFLLLFAFFVRSAVAENNPSPPGWLLWLQRPLCSLLHAHNLQEWEQRGCAHDDSASLTSVSPAFPSKPLFSLSSKTSPITHKSHTMVVCLQGLVKDHKETKPQSQLSQLNREGYGMNYFSRLLGLMGPHSNQGQNHEAELTNDWRDDSSVLHQHQHQPFPLLPMDHSHTDNDGNDGDEVSVPDTCADGDQR